MTSRERVEAALRHQPPDRTPIFEYVLLSPVADQLLGRPYGGDPANYHALVREKGWEEAVRRDANDRLDLAVLLGHDMLYVWPSSLPRQPEPREPSIELPEDPVDRMQRRNQEARDSRGSPNDDGLLIYALLAEEMARQKLDLPILAPAYVHGVWDDTDLMQTMLLAPEAAHEHFSLATERASRTIDRYVSLGVDQIGVGGDFAGNQPMISPRAYSEFIMPEVRRLSRAIHAAGCWAVNASDGNLWPVIEDFLTGCEVDGYLEIDMHAGMDLRRLKVSHGDRITFYGNLDCGNTLSFGSEQEVRQQVIRCIEAGAGSGGHILCASNAITASVPLNNYIAMVNAYREVFGLERLSI